MTPERADFVLASNIPDGKVDVMKLNAFNIEASMVRLAG